MQLLLAFIVALAVTVALMPLLMRLAGQFDLLDEPDSRKVHLGKVPRIGGLGMVVGVAVAALIWVPFSKTLAGVLTAALVLVLFGLADDKCGLNYKWKFFGQLLAASIVVIMGGVSIQYLPFCGLDSVPEYIGLPFSILVLVAATNAVNLSDGLDGLAGGIVLLTLGGMLVLAFGSDSEFVVAITVIVMAVIFGFLRFNTHPAIVFMGDTGSQFLGFMSAILAIQLTQVDNPALNPALPLLLLGVPILDTLLVMVKRIKAGKSPFSPDKNHLHHRLLGVGFAHYEAVFLIYLSQACFVVLAILLRYESDLLIVGTYVVTTALLVLGVERLEITRGKNSGNGKSNHITKTISEYDSYLSNNNVPLRVLNVAIPVFLVVTPVVGARVTFDLTLVAFVVGMLLLLRLLLGMKVAVLSLRLMIYMVMALCVYLGLHYSSGQMTETNIFCISMLGVMGVAGLLAMRYDRRGAFKTTPTDFLVIAITVAFGIVSRNSGLPDEFGVIAVGAVVAFYVAEIYIRQMTSRLNSLTISALLAVCLIVAKGISPSIFG